LAAFVLMLRSLLQSWLQNATKAKVREAVGQAVREQLAGPTAQVPAEAPKLCHLGVIFALGIESGCLEDLLQGSLTIRGTGFVIREGGLRGRRTVIILSGPGRAKAAQATEVLIDGHRPRRVVSAGFAGALCSELKRNDILIADRIVGIDGNEIEVDLPAGLSAALQQRGLHRGSLLTTDRVIRLAEEKHTLRKRFGAMAVDMETTAVAEVCLRRNVPFSSVRVINDTADQTLPRDVEHLLAQKTGAAQWGAALGAIWRRPASAKDMYMLRENALVASDRLAKFLAQVAFD
jgi:adenosylhomocysteine nucleosidase